MGKALGRDKKDDEGMEVVLEQNGLIGYDFGAPALCAKIPQRHRNDPSISLFIPVPLCPVKLSHRNTSHRPFCSLFPQLENA